MTINKILHPKLEFSNITHGFFTRREFSLLVRREKSIGIVWKQFISKTNDEFINHVIFVEKDGEILIDHCLIC